MWLWAERGAGVRRRGHHTRLWGRGGKDVEHTQDTIKNEKKKKNKKKKKKKKKKNYTDNISRAGTDFLPLYTTYERAQLYIAGAILRLVGFN